MKKTSLYIIFSLWSIFSIKAQDTQFSQFYSSPLNLGPSFAGAVEGSRVSGNYRNQWAELPNSFVTYSFSYDHYFSTFNSGVGILFYQDVAGTSALGSTQVSLHYSYNFQIANVWHVRPGLSFGYIQHGFNGDLDFIDDLPGYHGSTHAPVQTRDHARDIDMSTSALVYTKKFWVGFSVDHLLTPDISLYASESTLDMKFSAYGGYEFHRKGKLLKPSDETMTFTYLYKQQGTLKQLDLGVYWHNEPLVLGMWYRGIPFVNSHRGEALIFLVGIKTRSFNIGYSYDLTISNLIAYTRGSHEISATYKFMLPSRSKKGSVPCPEF